MSINIANKLQWYNVSTIRYKNCTDATYHEMLFFCGACRFMCITDKEQVTDNRTTVYTNHCQYTPDTH